MKKIIIETQTEEEDERIFHYIKQFCIENFRIFKLTIEGTELNFEQEWKKEEEKNEKESNKI